MKPAKPKKKQRVPKIKTRFDEWYELWCKANNAEAAKQQIKEQ
jgi:hypothetical protein